MSTTPDTELDLLRQLVGSLREIQSQNSILLKTIQHQIWHRDQFSPLKRNADTFLTSLLQFPKYSNHERLEHSAFKVFSQNGEDGMIQEVFRRIGTRTKRFIEFGVQSGHQCNTHLLLYLGWSGLWVEGDSNMFRAIEGHFAQAITLGVLSAKQSFLTIENINNVFKECGFVGDIDLLSVDIDGNDFHLCEALSVVSPRVIVVEFNASFPPPIKWIMPYDPDYRPDNSLYFGASLASFAEMMARRGYALVATDICGINAIFVRQEDAADKFVQAGDIASLYNPPRYGLGEGFPTGHPVPLNWRASTSA